MILEAILLIVGVILGVIGCYAYANNNRNKVADWLYTANIQHQVRKRGIDDGWLLSEVSGKSLIDECRNRDIPRYQDPVESLQSLEDDPETVYVWKVKDEAHRNQMIETIENHEHKHGEFEAIHAVTVEGEKELWRLEKQELEGYL